MSDSAKTSSTLDKLNNLYKDFELEPEDEAEDIAQQADKNLNVVRLDKQPPIKTFKSLSDGGMKQPKLGFIQEKNGQACNWCFKSLEKLNESSRQEHSDICRFRLSDSCLYCSRPLLSSLNDYNRKTHVEHCRNKFKTKIVKEMSKAAAHYGTSSGNKSKNRKKQKEVKRLVGNKKNLLVRNDDEVIVSDVDGKKEEGFRRRASLRLKQMPKEAILEGESAMMTTKSGEETELPVVELAPVETMQWLDDDDFDLNETQEEVAALKRSSDSGQSACKGYKPPFEFPGGESIYSNFPFQALDNDRENVKFVIENGVFHNHNCHKKGYQLTKDHRNGSNRLCNDLAYHKYLQNILKRSQIMANFSSIPHQYLTYNQLKKELNHYRETIKKLKLDNLNLNRTIDSLRIKDESYKRLVTMLAHNDYAKLSQIIAVCLNQKKGINGIIEKLLDCSDGVYHPRDKDVPIAQLDDVTCKLCSESVSLPKMREHVARHMQNHDVDEHPNRCGFCGQVDTCSILIKVIKDKSMHESAIWPESNCAYFKNFNLRMMHRQEKGLLLTNRPIECSLCNRFVWSFNMKAHYTQAHVDSEIPSGLTEEMAAAAASVSARGGGKNDEAPCRLCNELCALSRMRDHVAKHILVNEVEPDSNRCGFCGLVGCSIAIVVTSGKGKNTTYGPASSCAYFRKFNLKSSTKPTRSSPSTNRPIECHLCKEVYWSYNVKRHFGEKHADQQPPELITELERELIYRS